MVDWIAIVVVCESVVAECFLHLRLCPYLNFRRDTADQILLGKNEVCPKLFGCLSFDYMLRMRKEGKK